METTTTIKILDKIDINQNLICLIASFIMLCYTKEHHSNIHWLCTAGRILYYVSWGSVIVSTVFYTIAYCARKCYKAKHPEKA